MGQKQQVMVVDDDLGFICKPFEDAELEVLLGNALKQRQLSREVATLREQLKEQTKYTMLFGNSERMLGVRDLIERVSRNI